MAKAWTSMLPMVKLWPAWMDSTPRRRLPKVSGRMRWRASMVGWVTYRGGFQRPRTCGRPLQWSVCSWVMRTASRRSKSHPTAARRARVSRFPRPASTRMRVVSVSSSVKLPELPEARMETRRPIGDSPGETLKIMAERRERVNGQGGYSPDLCGRIWREELARGEITSLLRISESNVGALKAHLCQGSVLCATGSRVCLKELRIEFARLIQLTAENSRVCSWFK